MIGPLVYSGEIVRSASIFHPFASDGTAVSDAAITLTSSLVWNDASNYSARSILIGSSLLHENTATISFSGGTWYANFPRYVRYAETPVSSLSSRLAAHS